MYRVLIFPFESAPHLASTLDQHRQAGYRLLDGTNFAPKFHPHVPGYKRRCRKTLRSPSPHTTSTSSFKTFTSEQRQRTMSSFSTSISNSGYLKKKDEWLKAARESTEHFNTHGSPLPIVWVLTEGNNIPPNAVPFSEDVNGPLYIARALIEGHLYLGRAGRQFGGAMFTYAGKEITVSKYEVLTCASLLRWGFTPLEANGVLQQGTVVLAQQHRQNQSSERILYSHAHAESFNTNIRSADIPRYIPGERRIEAVMKRLEEIKTVILVDDSISMTEGNRWIQAMEAVGGIVDIANRHGPRGVDLHFMHQDGFGENLRSKDDVARVFSETQPDGDDTPTGARLAQIIEYYLPLIEARGSVHEPITIIILTDGAATDYDTLVQCIVNTARRLERNGLKDDMFGIQFIQIGTDAAAAEALRALDFDLEETYKIRDIVAAAPFSSDQGVFDTEYLLTILFSSIHRNSTNTPKPRGSQPSLAPLRPGLVQSPRRSLTPTLSAQTLSPRLSSQSLITQPKRGSVPLAQPQRLGQQYNRTPFSGGQLQSSNQSSRLAGGTQYVFDDYQREITIKRLSEIKTVILVDDSMSMTSGNLWLQAREALGGIVEIANNRGTKGIDLHFMHQEEFFGALHSRNDVTTLFDQVQPNGKDTPTGAKLGQLVEYYLPFIESNKSTHEPITIIVITDGEASDYDLLVQCVVETARRLERMGVKEDRFGIQFVQIGTDPAAAQALRTLDDDLERTYQIRDIVDSTPFDPDQGVFDTEYMLKILFGSIRRTLNDAPSYKPQSSVLSPRLGPLQGFVRSPTPLSGTVPPVLSIVRPRYVIQDYLREAAVKMLSETKTVFLVDESLSMTEGNLFFQARDAIAGIVEISGSQGLTGVDVHLLHQDIFAENILSVDDLTNLFTEVQLNGTDTPTGTRLAQLIEHYLSLIESEESTHLPVNIIVMSGGIATDPDLLVKCIVDAAQRLDSSGARLDIFGIQFIQMGTEDVTKRALRILGDNFGARHNVREILSTASFNPAHDIFDSGSLINILLGGIRKLFETHSIVQSAFSPLSSTQAVRMPTPVGGTPTSRRGF